MDTRTGRIYATFDEGMTDLKARGVSAKEARQRLIQGTRPTLRKLHKMIRKQVRRERKHGT